MAKALSYMPWFPRDFLASTRGWSVTAKGVYRELLDTQWELGTLPENPAELRSMIGATAKEWSEGWRRCEAKFPIVEGGRRNERLEEHRAKAVSLSDKRAVIGRMGGRPRKKDKEKAIAEAIGEAIAKPIAEPIAKPIGEANQKPPNPNPKKSPQPPLEGGPPASPASPGSPILEGEEPDREADPDAYLVWTAGLQMLGGRKGDRSLMGKLVKQHGQEAVARKVGEILGMKDRPQDPAAYLVASMKRQERRFMA